MAKAKRVVKRRSPTGEGKGGRAPQTEARDDVDGRRAWERSLRGDEGEREVRLLDASRLRHLAEAEQADIRRRWRELLQGLAPGQPPPPAPPGLGTAVNWTPIGPSVIAHGQASNSPPVSGRVRGLAVGPGGTRAYMGAANGGVWYTENGGRDWEPLEDYFMGGGTPTGLAADSLAVGAIAVRFGATRNDDLVYVGTGEPTGGDAALGVGIRRFGPPTGGGPPGWTLEATNLANRGIYRVIIDTENPERVFAATTAGFFERPTAGLATWTLRTPTGAAPASAEATDVALASTGTNRRYYVAYAGGDVRSFDPGASTWLTLTGVLGAGNRVCLAAAVKSAAEPNQRVVYALTQTGRLFRLSPGAGTAFDEVAGMPPVVPQNQGGYDLAIALEPNDPTRVWLTGDLTWSGTNWDLSLWRGTVSLTGAAPNFGFANAANPQADPLWMGRNVHGDGHTIAFPSDGAGSVWVGCDGGVFRSNTPTAAAGTFKPLNLGLAITQNTFMAQHPTTDAVVFVGCQDNGTVRYLGSAAWYEAPQGDGGGTAIDPNNPYQVMRQYVRAGEWIDRFAPGDQLWFQAGLYRSTDGGMTASGWSDLQFPPVGLTPTMAQKVAGNNENAATGFYAPIVSVAAGAATLAAFGTNRLWLTADWGTSWATVPTNTNPYAGGGTNTAQDSLGGAVTAIEFSGALRVFVATATTVYHFDNSGTVAAPVWSSVATAQRVTAGLPPNRGINDLAVVPDGTGGVYAVLGRSSTGSHVFYLAPGATSWTDCRLAVGGTVVNTPCHAAVVDPAHLETLYVASDVGVWRGRKGGTGWTWDLYSQGLPEVAVYDLGIHAPTRLLRAATHGRGVWEIELDATSLDRPEIYMRVNTADTGRLRAPGGQRYPWVEGHPDPTRQGFNVYHWMSPDIKVSRPSLVAAPASPVTFLDFAENIGDYVDSNNIETIDRAGVNRVFVQVHNRSLEAVVAGDARVLLLLTDAQAGLPPLPAGYANHIVNNHPATRVAPGWLAGSDWWPGDAATPYRTTSGPLDPRRPQIVEFNVDLAPLGLPATHEHVCSAAFVTTISGADRLTATEASLDALTMRDRHVVHRNLHAVVAAARPSTDGRPLAAPPQTFFLDVANHLRKGAEFEVEFIWKDRGGQLSMVAAPLRDAKAKFDLKDWGLRRDVPAAQVQLWSRWGRAVEAQLGLLRQQIVARDLRVTPSASPRTMFNTLDRAPLASLDDFRARRLSKLALLDPERVYIAHPSERLLMRAGLPVGERIVMALTWAPPRTMQPGERQRLDVIQRRGDHIVGGATYWLSVAAPPRR